MKKCAGDATNQKYFLKTKTKIKTKIGFKMLPLEK